MSKFRSIFADSRTKAVNLPSALVGDGDGEQDATITVNIRKISHAGKRRINDAERTRANGALKNQMDELGKDGLELIEDIRAKYEGGSKSKGEDGDDPTMVARPSRVEREAASIAAEAQAKAEVAVPEDAVDTDSVEQMLGSMDLIALLKEGVAGWNVTDDQDLPVPFNETAIDALADDIVMWIAEQVLVYNRRSFRLTGERRSGSGKR